MASTASGILVWSVHKDSPELFLILLYQSKTWVSYLTFQNAGHSVGCSFNQSTYNLKFPLSINGGKKTTFQRFYLMSYF